MLIPVITAADVQDAVIPLLQSYAPLTGGEAPLFTGKILDDDPQAPDGPGDVQIALHLLAEGEQDAVPGPEGAGAQRYVSYFAALVYVGQANRDRATKRQLTLITGALRKALMQDGGPDSMTGLPGPCVRRDPHPVPVQRWYSNAFKAPVASLYQNGGAFRRSITFIEFYSKLRN